MSGKTKAYRIHVHFIAVLMAITIAISLILADYVAFDHGGGTYSDPTVPGLGTYVFSLYPAIVMSYWVLGIILVTPIRLSIAQIDAGVTQTVPADRQSANTWYLILWPFASLIAFVYVPLVLVLQAIFRE